MNAISHRQLSKKRIISTLNCFSKNGEEIINFVILLLNRISEENHSSINVSEVTVIVKLT